MSDTTTVRLSAELKRRLDQAARQMARGKSWIIGRALDEYLARAAPPDIAREARRQCRLANRAARREGDWERFGDWPE